MDYNYVGKTQVELEFELTELRLKVREILYELQEAINDLCRLRDRLYPAGYIDNDIKKE